MRSLFTESFVEAACAISLDVQGYVPKTKSLELIIDLHSYVIFHEMREVLRQELDARNIAVMTYAELCEAKGKKQVLGLVYHFKFLTCNGVTVWNAACKAGKRGFAPGWKAKML